ncbi:MAG: riboflavin synthase [Cyanobacteriota bacterium erpe_2018_sw_21hr_WHONDRS-SW48-000092_B_bin.40]|nr:riboflavin synthase [Cyanobacteriota bacterium erpe_2018_sw_21hr_WHONDRS-SW48-000092_B_bin.40]
MFSGIVEEVGEVLEVQDTADGRWLKIGAKEILADAALGESISCSGCCLTVVDFGSDWFAVEAVIETLRRTKIGDLKVGSKINLEKALRVSDRLGGHIVTGHIDTVGKVASIVEEGFSYVVEVNLDSRWAPFFVEKGSVAMDGVSLTVADCGEIPEKAEDEFWFRVALIPHTWNVTTLGQLKVGSAVNIETDIIARYVARLTNTNHK